MKLTSNSEDLAKDLQDLVNLFFKESEEPFEIFHEEKIKNNEVTNKFVLSGEKKGEYIKSFELESRITDLHKKSLRKRKSKVQLYEILSSITGKKLPWGSLTGIRPCKFARDLVDRGEIKDHLITETLVNEYKLSMDKAKLVFQTLKNQKCIIRNDNLVDLYINIPICPTRCSYCSFISSEYKSVQNLIDTYIDCVIKELNAVKELVKEKAYIIRTVYIGGGTPTVLSAEQLERLLKEILYQPTEFTVECGRPDTITRDKLEVLKKYGVTRISINPQTFCEATLKRIGRQHNNKDVLEAYSLALEYDFDINMDIIAGLPLEKFGIFKRTISRLLELYPQNITIHTLSVKNSAVLKSEQETLEDKDVPKMVEYSLNELRKNGYEPYYIYRQKHQLGGLENVGYARDKKFCIFNIDSMEDISSIIAVGANGISKRIYNYENKIEREQNCKFIQDYINRIDEMIEKKFKLFS